MMVVPGMFYGIGVGPGDPDLVTLKARDLMNRVDVLAYPTSSDGGSLARHIAAPFIPPEKKELPIHVPMSTAREPAQTAYDQAAQKITSLLEEKLSVGFLCEGDPLFYGSYMYLHARIAPSHQTSIIPGITSLTACAAALGAPLAGRNDVLKVVPATLDETQLREELGTGDKIVIIKVGRHFAKVRALLREFGLAEAAMIVSSATRDDEQITLLEDIPEGAQPYFSTIIVSRGGETW